MRRYQAEQEDIKNMKEYVVWHQSLFEASCS
jgi:hypothetical protein